MYLRFAVFVLAAAGTANIAMGFNSPGAILAQHHLARIKQDLKGSAIDASRHGDHGDMRLARRRAHIEKRDRHTFLLHVA